MKRRLCLLFCATASAGLAGNVADAFSSWRRGDISYRSTRRFPSISASRSTCTSSTSTNLPMAPHPIDTPTLENAGKETTVRIAKPLGIVVDEVDPTDPNKGTCIGQISAGSNTAVSCGTDVCIHDRIVAVNGISCSNESFEVVMDMIASSPGDDIELTIRRSQGTVAVQWPNGICVAAPVGEYLGNVANEARYSVPYSCRSGSCGSCEHIARVDDGKERRYRPCSARVPKGVEKMEFYSQY